MSYNCTNYNCDDLGEHQLNDCGDRLEKGFSAAVILECDHEITDPSNASQITDAISAGKATLVKDINATIGTGSPVTQESTVAQSMDTLTRYDWSGTWIDGNVNSENVSFYNALSSERSAGGLILFNRLENKVFFINEEIKFRVVLDDSGELIIFTGAFVWRARGNNGNPEIYDAPAGVFN